MLSDFDRELQKYSGVEIPYLPDFSSCFTPYNLIKAANKCFVGVIWKGQVMRFYVNRVEECMTLLYELFHKTYELSLTYQFKINERGKIRNIKSINIRDRVVQRCLCDHILVPLTLGVIIDDNAACLKDRGLSYALGRVRTIVSEAPDDAYVLRFDFKSYFNSLRHDYMFSLLKKFIKDPQTLDLFALILDSNKGGESGKGLELGSHVSQICGIFYPDLIDKELIKFPGVIGYHRYMDDGLVICSSKEDAKKIRDFVISYASIFGLTVHQDKTYYSPIKNPITFCQRVITKDGNNVHMSIKRKSIKRSRRHLLKVMKLGGTSEELIPVFASILGYWNGADDDLTDLFFRCLDEYGDHDVCRDVVMGSRFLTEKWVEHYTGKDFIQRILDDSGFSGITDTEFDFCREVDEFNKRIIKRDKAKIDTFQSF